MINTAFGPIYKPHEAAGGKFASSSLSNAWTLKAHVWVPPRLLKPNQNVGAAKKKDDRPAMDIDVKYTSAILVLTSLLSYLCYFINKNRCMAAEAVDH